ncbi:MAG: alpha/beta fold hydrolase [Planctomycetes bacterium]|nr:alpha/beta fold hydrolase [Planctomycetota bacterium]
MALLGLTTIDILLRNWALVTMLSTIAAIALLAMYVIRKYVRISLNIMRTTRPPFARGPLDFERMAGESAVFSAFDGHRLAGLMLRADPSVPRRGLIIFAHEYCSDMHSCARYCRHLHESGYDVFAFDFRGHGQSECPAEYTPRQWVTDREVDDIRGALAYIEDWLDRQSLPRRIGLFGISRGACAAILIAAEDQAVQAIVADGAFSTDTTIEHLMRRWAYIFATVRVLYENHHPAFWRFLRWCMVRCASREFRCKFPSVRKAIARMTPRPIFFIHGEKDSYLPVEQSRLLYALAPQPKHLWIAPSAKHNQAVICHPEIYARLTREFFDEHLWRPTIGEAAVPPVSPREVQATGRSTNQSFSAADSTSGVSGS